MSRGRVLVVGFFPHVRGALVPHRVFVESELLRRSICGNDDTRWVVGAGSAFFSCNVHSLSRSCLVVDTGGRLFGMGRDGFWHRLRRGLHWWPSMVKSNSLARGVMTMMVVFLLGGGCGLRGGSQVGRCCLVRSCSMTAFVAFVTVFSRFSTN